MCQYLLFAHFKWTNSIHRVTVEYTIAELQEQVGQAVNTVMSFLQQRDKVSASLRRPSIFSKILYNALILALTRVFTHGLKKSSGIFRYVLELLLVIFFIINPLRDKFECWGKVRCDEFSARDSSHIN